MSEVDGCECPPTTASTTNAGQDDILRVMREFQSLYNQKLEEIDKVGGGENLQLKVTIQEKWINDLTAQTEMMAAMVKDLEEEATQRVRMLEKKLQQTSKAAYEVMKRYQTYNFQNNSDDYLQKRIYLENDVKNLLEFIRRIREDGKWSIKGLQFYDVNYTDLFGQNNFQCNNSSEAPEKVFTPENPETENLVNFCEDVKAMNNVDELKEKLKVKNDECDNLRQNMIDMRSALTEEVACKHDMILSLKKDVQKLEERCVQSDKQTAFKDDIIKELRKEIKQLKQTHQEKCFNDKMKSCEDKWCEEKNKMQKKVGDLEKQLCSANNKIGNMKPLVPVRSTCTMIEEDLSVMNKSQLLIQNKNETIQLQNNTLNIIQNELQGTKKKELEMEDQIAKRRCEVENLKCRCHELELALANAHIRAENLQKAVDLYVNSINVLEASEERAKIEIEQQRITILNLQEALVVVKQELGELRQKNEQEMHQQQYYTNVLYINLQDIEDKYAKLEESYKKLQDTTFQLEIEHFNSLQDLALADTQLHKYQIEFREYEGQRTSECKEVKKLKQQKRYYEHVIECFKQEMCVMSEQLIHLQEILNLSNQSCKEENCHLYNAVVDLQKLSDRLRDQLQETEKQALVENQRNKENNSKIDELKKIIDQKNEELNMHDQAIAEMQLNLENTILQNHQLEATVAHLNTEIMKMQCNLEMERTQKAQKVDDCKSQVEVCSRSLSDFEDHMNRKNRKIARLQTDYRKQQAILEDTTKELGRVKEKSKAKIKHLKKQNELLKAKIAKSEASYVQMCEEFTCMRDRATELTQQEFCRDHDLTLYKQIVIEIRQALIELNSSLSESETRALALVDPEIRNRIKDNYRNDDIIASCRSELNSFKKLIDTMRSSLHVTTRKIREMERENEKLTQESKLKDDKINDLHNLLSSKDTETGQNLKELVEKFKISQAEEQRLHGVIEDLKEEMRNRLDNRRDIATTQDEISTLKSKIKKMIQDQVGLNRENDRLLAQVTRLQDLIAPLEEKNRKMKKMLDEAQTEIQKLREGNNYVQRQKDSIVKELEALQTSYKMELADTKNSRDEVCADSISMVHNVKAWLEEQRKINERVKSKTRDYSNKIEQLRQEKGLLQQRQQQPQQQLQQQQPGAKMKCTKCPYSGMDYQNQWSLGSQGTGSWDSPRDSPSSFLTCSVEEWYAPNYRDEDDTDELNEGLLGRIEAVTAGIRVGNRRLTKCREGVVSKDIN